MNEDADGPESGDRTAGTRGWAAAVVEGMHDGAIAVDASSRIAFVNGAVVESIDVDREALVGAPVERLLAADLLDRTAMGRILTAIDRVCEQDADVATCEVPFSADGTDRTLEIVWTPVERPVAGAVGIVRDVTHRVSIGRELRERRRTIERLHEASAEIVACETPAAVCDRAVAAAEEILGLGRCAIALESDGELSAVAASTAPDDAGLTARSSAAWTADRAACDGDGAVRDGADRSRQARADAGTTDASAGDLGGDATGRTTARADSSADRPSREPGPVHGRADSDVAIVAPVGDLGVFRAEAPEPDAFDDRDVEHVELLVAYVAETLRRIDVEATLRERERALVSEHDRLAALFENVPDPVVAYEFHDGEPIVRDVNAAFEETFGFDRGAVRGENVDEYIVPPDAEPEARRLNAKLQAGERLRTAGRRETADGVRDFLLNVVPIEVGERGVEGFAIYTDITEQKARQRELERRNDRLEEFASIVSHDLRNPLGVADGFFELAVESGDEAHVERVRNAHRRMDTMIDELLSLAREGDVVGETQPVDLEEAATRAWACVDTPAASLAVRGTATIEADDDRLVELLENCFRNSVEHGGDDVRVTVGPTAGSRTDAASATGFYVADDGPGVPPDERDRIFDSGFTTRAAGTGYGLSIVRQIAEGHGWTVSVEESDAGGARFVFEPAD